MIYWKEYGIYVNIVTREKLATNFPLSFIGQFVHPVGGEGIGYIVILASYKFNFMRIHDNLV